MPETLTTISVFTRHSKTCPKKSEGPMYKGEGCKCLKSLYIREGKQTKYVSCHTRSWKDAEKMKREEEDKRNPVNIALQAIADQKAAAEKAQQDKLKPFTEALDQWIAGMKKPGDSSIAQYRSTANTILRWSQRENVKFVSDVTPSMLDEWVASWSEDAEEEYNQFALNTQQSLITRIKAFFRWCTAMEFTSRNPSEMLKAIQTDDSATMPLTPEQFNELLSATYQMDKDARYEYMKIGQHLRAIFLVQRFSGLRVGDVLSLPKSALNGNRLKATIQKKLNRKGLAGSTIECLLPDHVVSALKSLPSHSDIHPDYFFWNGKCDRQINVTKWLRKIKCINKYVNFKDEEGQPMAFRSHMLRDTFSVELLLAGVPIEHVSKLLTHESVTITERYYNKFTSRRKAQLEDIAVTAMRSMGATFGGD